jgi:uncharacterized protein GlcG (DUF336 family)
MLKISVAALPLVAGAAESTFTVRLLTPETALKAAQAALAKCRQEGYQIAVAIVDRGGVTQVLLRDRFAGPHTVDVATAKAWTAASFRNSTTALAEETQPGKPMNGVRTQPHVAMIGGGLMIEAAGSLLGGIGVSGAPGGHLDEMCAQAGTQAIREDLDF